MSHLSDDYYEVLGVPKTADLAAIKRAYKKAALQWHPDKNPDNRDHAENVFKRVSEAYQILSDADKRQQYDRYGKAAFQLGGNTGRDRDEGRMPQQFDGGQQFFFQSRGGTSGMGGNGFRFRSARDIFQEFFGGRDPFADFGDMFGDFDDFGGPFQQSSSNCGQGSNSRSRGGMSMMARGGMGGMGMNMGFGGFGGNSPFDDPFFQSSSIMGGGGGMNSFASSSFSSSSSGGRGGTSKSVKTTTTIRNGQKVTTVTTTIRDANGNVTTNTQEHVGGGSIESGSGNSRIRVGF